MCTRVQYVCYLLPSYESTFEGTTGSTSGSTSGSIDTSVLSRAPSYVHVIVRVHEHVQYNGVVYVDKKKFILIVQYYRTCTL